jgi:hypothetical protein
MVVLGVVLPLVGWWFTRKPPPLDTADRGHGEMDRWLVDQFGLGWRDRSRVRAAVLAGRPVEDPALEAAARGFAAQVTADRFRTLRVARRVGWFNTMFGLGYVVLAIVVLIISREPAFWTLGVFGVFNGGAALWAGTYQAVRTPKRHRRNAELILHSSRLR